MKEIESLITQEELTRKDVIIQCINEIKNDFHVSPLFYDPDSIKYLESDTLISNVQSKINRYYTLSCGYSFAIPYDTISERIAISLQSEDLVIRYLLRNTLEKITNFKLFTRLENERLLQDFVNKSGDGFNIFKIDINNYYESVNHSNFIESICNEYKISNDSLFIHLLESNLKIVYRSASDEIVRKDKGFSIGIKPDEYFANLYMQIIAKKIKSDINIEIANIDDEILFFAKSLNNARSAYKKIEKVINEHRLEINRSKNKSVCIFIPEIEKSKSLTLKNENILVTSSFFSNIKL
jgi:hypothetical protein